MSRFSRLCVSSVCAVVLCWFVAVANATYITSDGNFGNQTDGVKLASPWGDFATKNAYGYTATQSPFTNVFANNSMEAHWSQGVTDAGVSQSFTTISSAATGSLYLNVDFMLSRTDTTDGGFSLYLTRDMGQQFSTATIYVNTAGGIYAQNGSSSYTSSFLMPEMNTWYNLQLTVDMTNHQYDGVITRAGTLAQTKITTQSFAHSSQDINNILIWNYTANRYPTNYLDTNIDNCVLSNTAFASAIPEPMSIVSLGIGLLGLLAYAWWKRK